MLGNYYRLLGEFVLMELVDGEELVYIEGNGG